MDFMGFGWDARKSKANQANRGFEFEFAARIFEGDVLEKTDDRQDYGEVRVKAIGEVSGRVLAVIYTDRNDMRWIISARPASRKERKLWQTRSRA